MAAPKVFVSSTCFDLSEIREQLSKFIRSFGFEPVLSEHGDVFYKPEFHTHESCLREISNCHLFVLIIGGRFGGEYVYDKTKSITNAEYLAARHCNLPIFTYVRSNVLANHHIYAQNKKKDFVTNIDYPAIEKQEHAIDIFQFIDDVRRSPVNNAFESFVNFQDIEAHLRKQWAGLFFDLLRSREIVSQISVTNQLISAVQLTSDKLEELVKSLYISSNRAVAEQAIAAIDAVSEIELFFETVLRPEWVKKEARYWLDETKVDLKAVSEVSPVDLSWHEYLVATGIFEHTDYPTDDEGFETEVGLRCMVSNESNTYFVIGIKELDDVRTPALYEQWVRLSTSEQREKALEKVFDRFGVVRNKKKKGIKSINESSR